jgi:hypothetical protein
MLFAAAVVFFLSVALIAGLFWLKYWEVRYERVLWGQWRDRADSRAVGLKTRLQHTVWNLSHIAPVAGHLSRFLVHEVAMLFAAIARVAETQAHRLADLVSHKHRFERRETQSDFLKQVAERKNGNAN